MYMTGYCFISAVVFLILGLSWSNEDPTQRAIKFTLIFLAVWGAFFGMLMVKGYHV